MKVFTTSLASPLGSLFVATTEHGRICRVSFATEASALADALGRRFSEVRAGAHPSLALACARLTAYFEGELSALSDLEIDAGGTLFQAQVWQALRRIPAGQTLSYGALAREIGRPKATRAVGLACGQNPIAVVVPCHRVIGADGSLTGFAAGLAVKRWLLAHEQKFRYREEPKSRLLVGSVP